MLEHKERMTLKIWKKDSYCYLQLKRTFSLHFFVLKLHMVRYHLHTVSDFCLGQFVILEHLWSQIFKGRNRNELLNILIRLTRAPAVLLQNNTFNWGTAISLLFTKYSSFFCLKQKYQIQGRHVGSIKFCSLPNISELYLCWAILTYMYMRSCFKI